MKTPKGWTKTKLTNAFWFQEGPGVRKWQFKNEGIKLINVSNITTDGVLDLSKTDRHLEPQEVEEKYQHFLIDPGDFVIASSGISFDDDGFLKTRGVFISEDDLPLCMNTSTIRFKAKEGVADLRFFQYWLDSFEFRSQVSKFVTGSAQLNFGPTHLKKMSITLPPLAEQRRIAAVLDKAATLRSQRQQAIAKLDTLLQAVFLDMFGDPVTNPKAWETRPLGKLISHVGSGATPRGGSKVYQDSGILFIRSQNVLMFEFDFSDAAYISNEIHNDMKRSWVEQNDVLLNITGASIGRVNYFGREHGDTIANVNQHVCIIRPKLDKLLPEYLTYHIGMQGYQQKIIGENAGATRQAFNYKQIRAFDILLPPIKQQQIFREIVKRYKGVKRLHETGYQSCESLFNSLQQRAFRGEL